MVADKSAKVSDMFRFGMQMPMPESFENIIYYGRGPVENYIDRNHSTDIGIYSQTVTEQFYPYIRPQENGTKTDIRWWKLFNEEGKGLMFVAEKPFSASALHYTMESLDDGSEKNQRLACVDSWGAIPRPEYRIPYDDYEFTFIMTPISSMVIMK